MLQIVKKDVNINFLRYGNAALVFSGLLLLAGVVSLFTQGLNLGLDFTGGALIELHYPEAPEMDDVRSAMEDAGFDDFVVQTFGSSRDIMIRMPTGEEGDSGADISTRVLEALSERAEGIEMRRVEFVGPQIGRELTEQGGLALLYVFIGIMIYVSVRFQWRLAAAAVIALVHDTLVVIGLLSIFQASFDLTVVAAILALIGYSINDTVVIYDRVRENVRRNRKGTPYELMNQSINQTLARTIMTSLTTLVVLVALYVFGGEVINAFALTLMLGVVIGTYSSVYLACSLSVKFGVSKADLMMVKKEGADDDQPEREILPERFRNRGA